MPNAEDIRAFVENAQARCKTLLETKAEDRERHLKLLTERASVTGFERRLQNLMQETDRGFDMLLKAYGAAVEKREAALSEKASKLDALSPLKVFDRGYSVASLNGKIIKSTEDAAVGDNIEITLKDGSIFASVTKTERSELYDI